MPDIDALERAASDIEAFGDVGLQAWSELLLALSPGWELRELSSDHPQEPSSEEEADEAPRWLRVGGENGRICRQPGASEQEQGER